MTWLSSITAGCTLCSPCAPRRSGPTCSGVRVLAACRRRRPLPRAGGAHRARGPAPAQAHVPDPEGGRLQLWRDRRTAGRQLLDDQPPARASTSGGARLDGALGPDTSPARQHCERPGRPGLSHLSDRVAPSTDARASRSAQDLAAYVLARESASAGRSRRRALGHREEQLLPRCCSFADAGAGRAPIACPGTLAARPDQACARRLSRRPPMKDKEERRFGRVANRACSDSSTSVTRGVDPGDVECRLCRGAAVLTRAAVDRPCAAPCRLAQMRAGAVLGRGRRWCRRQ